MIDNDFRIELKTDRRKLVLEKKDIVYDDVEDTWYLCFSTNDLGAGDIIMVVYADVPDIDFDDVIRTEVYKCTLCHVENV